jgi:hypothetical protein
MDALPTVTRSVTGYIPTQSVGTIYVMTLARRNASIRCALNPNSPNT